MINNQSENFHKDTEMPDELYDEQTHRIILDRYFFAGELSKEKNILEIGPGSGIGINYLEKITKQYKGLEFSSENIKVLRNRDFASAEIFHGDAHEMPFDENSFEVIIALAMIYYLSLEDFLKEAYRCLEDDGLLFFCTSNKDIPGFCAAPYTTEYYSVPQLNNILKKAGFTSEFYGAFPTTTRNLFINRLKAFVKDSLKYLFYRTDIGKGIWIKLRLKYLGDLEPLTKNITKENIKKVYREKLDESKVDFNHKIIYVVARKSLI